MIRIIIPYAKYSTCENYSTASYCVVEGRQICFCLVKQLIIIDYINYLGKFVCVS